MKNLKKYTLLLLCAFTSAHAVYGPIITDISDYTPMFKHANLSAPELEEFISTYSRKISEGASSVHSVVNAIADAYGFVVDNQNTIALMFASAIFGGFVVKVHQRYKKYCKQQEREKVEKIVRNMPEIKRIADEEFSARKLTGSALDATSQA